MAMKSLPQLRSMFSAPQLMHRWQIQIPTWPVAVAPANPDILFFVTTSSLPKEEVQDAEVELGGFKMNFNGKSNRNGELEWTFFENVDQAVTKYFLIDYPNKRQNFSSISDINLKASAEADLIVPVIVMSLLDSSGQKISSNYKLINAKFKPSDAGGELGQEGVAQKPVVTVAYDAFVIEKP